MPRSILFLVLLFSSLSVYAQEQPPAKPQTARQALLEILTGDENAIAKHMTVEVQQSLKAPKSQSGMMALGTVSALRGLNQPNREVFDTGPVLIAVNEPKTHERLEIHVEGDDLAGDEDTLQLSVHAFRDGQEIDTPMQVISQIQVNMKKQVGLWRLNAITVSVVLPVGDPKLMERLTNSANDFGGGMWGGKVGASSSGTAERSKPDTKSTLQMLAMLEGTYATSHADSGFTCSLSDVIDNNKPLVEALQVDPTVATGVLNGYKFTLSGCQGSPAASFQITAEPVSPAAGAKAFCTDATHNVRVSNDGRGSTCLSSGKVEHGRGNTALLPESHTEIVLH